MRNASSTPTNNNNTDVAKGTCQLPVRSIRNPNTDGDKTPAIPKPRFIIPPAVPAYCGAMSIGSAHSTGLHNSRKKNAKLRRIDTVTRLWMNKVGSRNNKDPSNPTTRFKRRANFKLPVRTSRASERKPPAVSPITPASMTPVENHTNFFTGRWYDAARKDGSHVR